MSSKGGVIVVVSGQDNTGEVFAAIKQHLAETQAKAKETSDSLGEMGAVLQRGLQTAGIVIGVREIVGAFGEMVKSSMEAGVQIGHLAKQTGISVENLSVLKYAAAESGVEFETLTKGFKKLSTEIFNFEHGSQQTKETFAALNISQKDLTATGGDMYKVLELVADRFASMPDGANKNALATQLFGRAGQELIPVLDEGAKGIEEYRAEAEALGIVLDAAGIKKIEELHKSVESMKGSWAGLGLEITDAFAKPLQNAAIGMSEFMQMMRLSAGQTLKASYGFVLDGMFGSLGPGKAIEDEATAKFIELQGAVSKKLEDESKATTTPPPGLAFSLTPEEIAKIKAAQQRLDDSLMQLAEGAAKLDQARAKQNAESQLAILESAHKMGLISESSYLTQKAALQQKGFEQERAAIQAQQSAISAEMKTLGSKKPGTKEERLDQQAKLNGLKTKALEIDEKSLDIATRQTEAAAALDEARKEALDKQAKQIAQMEAELEQMGGSGAAKAIAAQRLDASKSRQDLSNGGATTQQLAEFDALEKLKEEKLQIAAIDREAQVIQREAGLAEAKVEQGALSHAITQRDAEQQLTVIRNNEITQLKAISDAYGQYGQAGRDAEEKIQESITQTMQQMIKQEEQTNALRGELEKFAHGIFDPLFDMNEKWNKQWKQMRENMVRDAGQLAESQLFGALFGDPSGKGGRGLDGTGGTKPSAGPLGLKNQAGGLLGSLLGLVTGKKSAAVSNGGLGAGAGTIPSAAAAAAQMGGGAAVGNGAGGIQVIINNTGTPQTVTQTSGGAGMDPEQTVIQIFMKDLGTNGPMSQGIAGLIALG